MKKLRYIFVNFLLLFLILNITIWIVTSLEHKFDKERQGYIEEVIKYKNESMVLQINIRAENRTNVSLHDSINSMLTFNADNVIRYLDYFDIAHEDIVFKQSLLETGRYNSEVFLENNNLFGMRHPLSRATTSKGSNLNHALYLNYLESIKDYKIYQDYYYDGRPYYSFLIDKGYATDTKYIRKIKSFDTNI